MAVLIMTGGCDRENTAVKKFKEDAAADGGKAVSQDQVVDHSLALLGEVDGLAVRVERAGERTLAVELSPVNGEGTADGIFRREGLSAELQGGELRLGAGDKSLGFRFRALGRYGRASVPGLEMSWGVSDEEGIYGLGERFDRLNQNGRVVEMWIEDEPGQGDGGATYFVTPMLLSGAGYAFWTDDNPEGAFDVNAGGSGRCVYQRAGRTVRFYVAFGDDLQALVRERAAVRGAPRGIPDWSWGPWVSRNSFETQAEAEEVLREMAARKLPVAAIVQEAWKGPSEPGLFNAFDPGRWAGVSNYMAACARADIKNILWQVPILHPSSPHFKEGEAKGYFVKDPEGKVSLREHWLAGFANIDFTNPDAVKFWQDLIRPVVKMGVAGFKADDGEAIKPDDVFFDGRRGWQMHNEYSRLYGQALQDLLDEENADGMLWARSGSLGIDQIPALWAGDQFANWQQMRSLIPAGLSCAMSGVAFWGHDIGGYIDQPSEELYIRWVQFGALSPLMQYHGIQRREPWEFGMQAEAAYRRMVYLRMNLKPELIRMGRQTVETGLPMMRPMALAFPGDTRFRDTDDQYMLGDDLLVFPVLEEGARSRRVLIPEGVWYSLDGRRRYTGPAEMELPVALLDVPLLVRDGATLRMQLAEGAEPGDWSPAMPERDWQVPVDRVVFDNLSWNGRPDTVNREALALFTPAGDAKADSLSAYWYFDAIPDKKMPARLVQKEGRLAFSLIPSPKRAVEGHSFTLVVLDADRQEVLRLEGTWHSPVDLHIEQADQMIENGERKRILKAVMKNNTERELSGTLHFRGSGSLRVDPADRQITLPPGQEQDVRFDVQLPSDSAVGNTVVKALLAGPSGIISGTQYDRLNAAPRWAAIGPFPAEKKEAFRTVYAPETLIDATAAYRTDNGELRRWQPIKRRALDASGSERFDFNKLWGPHDDAAAYIMTRLYATRAQTVELHAGSDDTLTVWLNGRQVFANEAYRGASADQDLVELPLRPGANTVLIKVGQHVAGWELLVRFTGKNGKPLRGIREGFSDYNLFSPSSPVKRTVQARAQQYNPPRWIAVGPFDAPGKTAFAAHFPPESDWSASSTFGTHKGEPIRWRQVATEHDKASGADYIDFLELWPGTTNAACYALTKFRADRARRVLLHAGSDDTLAVWLNGRKVFAKEVYRGAQPDQEVIPLFLKDGINTLLVKVTQDVGGWMLYTRFTDDDGNPPLGLRSGFDDYDRY
jgi:alpha-D-xyloside xylohydrolase